MSVSPECAVRWSNADGVLFQQRRQFCAIVQRYRVTAYSSHHPLKYSNAVLCGVARPTKYAIDLCGVLADGTIQLIADVIGRRA